METLQSIIDAMAVPQTRHAALVHLPVALALLATPVAGVLLFSKGRSLFARWLAFSLFTLLAASGLLAIWSGEDAFDTMGLVPEAAKTLAHDHGEIAERLWNFGALGAVLVVLTWMNKPRVRTTAASLTLALAMVTTGWAVVAAHMGGKAVYIYGVGTPVPITQAALDGEASTLAAADPRVAFFEAEVWPVLNRRCVNCHAPGDTAGGLDMTTMASLLLGGESGPAIVPGDPEASLIYTSAARTHPELKMPKNQRPLEPAELDAVGRWIREGAAWNTP